MESRSRSPCGRPRPGPGSKSRTMESVSPQRIRTAASRNSSGQPRSRRDRVSASDSGSPARWSRRWGEQFLYTAQSARARPSWSSFPGAHRRHPAKGNRTEKTRDSTPPPPPPLPRLATGIAHLDVILSGGFLRGGSYIVAGSPGAGKTILGNQVCFHHVAQGERAVYLTLLSESHGRMVAHLSPMSFFEPSAVGTKLHYVSGYNELRAGKEGLKG